MYPNELVEYMSFRTKSPEETIRDMVKVAQGNEWTSKTDYWKKIQGITVIVGPESDAEKEIQRFYLQQRMEKHCSDEDFLFALNKIRYAGLCSCSKEMELPCRVARFIQTSAKKSDISIDKLLRQTFVSLATVYSREELHSIAKSLWTYWIHRDLFLKFSVDSLFRDNGRKKKKRILA